LVRELTNRLDSELLPALFCEAWQCVLQGAAEELTLEVFICGLYMRNRERLLVYFEDGLTLDRMLESMCPFVRGSRGSIVPATASSSDGLVVRVAPTLVQILSRALDLSRAAGHEKAGLEDFVRSLAADTESVAKLQQERGLRVKKL